MCSLALICAHVLTLCIFSLTSQEELWCRMETLQSIVSHASRSGVQENAKQQMKFHKSKKKKKNDVFC